MFTYWNAIVGGGLLGLVAGLMWLLGGRVLGCSNFIYSALTFQFNRANLTALFFIIGLILSAMLTSILDLNSPPLYKHPVSVYLLLFGGYLVGLGTYIANGCTSGHGLCGLSRFSKRSFIAVISFFLSAIVTAWLIH